jgi:hypothetical protein
MHSHCRFIPALPQCELFRQHSKIRAVSNLERIHTSNNQLRNAIFCMEFLFYAKKKKKVSNLVKNSFASSSVLLDFAAA